MGGVLLGFAVIGTVIALGYLLGRSGTLGPSGQQVLARLVFSVGTPALLFSTLARTDVHRVFSESLLVNAVSVLVAASLYVLLARVWMRRPAGEITIGALSASYVNAGNLGIPIAVYVLGDASYVAPLMLFQMAVMGPIAMTVLDSLAARRDTDRADPADLSDPSDPADLSDAARPADPADPAVPVGRPSPRWRRTLRPLLNPILLASLLGLLVAGLPWEVPEPLLQPVELVAGIAVPGALLAFGISLRGAPLPGRGELRRPVWTSVLIKVTVQPLVAYLVTRFLLDADPKAVLAATVLAALPTAHNVFVFANRYQSGILLAREAILLSSVFSAVVIMLVAAVLA